MQLPDPGGKINISKTFRRRPRRLQNVLCAFNLRPVSKELPIFSYVQLVTGKTLSR